jgi:hypothetical protein
VPVRENSIEGLRSAIVSSDGIEFDLRMLDDGSIVLHHDRSPSIPSDARSGGSPHVEGWAFEDLKPYGLERFETMLEDTTIVEAWRTQAKVGVIELKRPHPHHVGGRRGFDDRTDLAHMARLASTVHDALNAADIPAANTVLYAFHPRMSEVVKQAGWTRPWSRLTPNLPPFGGRTMQRTVAAPSFLRHSFASLVRRQQQAGSPMMPCTLDYLTGLTKHLHVGRSVGLHGAAMQRLRSAQKGFPVYVWPAPLALEADLLDAGLTCISDDVTTVAPRSEDGRVRWTRPATAPLSGLAPSAASDEEAVTLHAELQREVAPWHELSTEERRVHLEAWRGRWSWKRTVDDLLQDVAEDGSTMPWEAVRMVGHRGCGVTPRPVLSLNDT